MSSAHRMSQKSSALCYKDSLLANNLRHVMAIFTTIFRNSMKPWNSFKIRSVSTTELSPSLLSWALLVSTQLVTSSVGFGILMADHVEVDHEDIMCGFDEANELVGVPKVFLFNVCVNSWTPTLRFHAGLFGRKFFLHWQGVGLTLENFRVYTFAGWDQKYRNLPFKNPEEYVKQDSLLFKMRPDVKCRYKTSRRFVQNLKDMLLNTITAPHFVPSADETCSVSQFLTRLERTLPPFRPCLMLIELLSRVSPIKFF